VPRPGQKEHAKETTSLVMVQDRRGREKKDLDQGPSKKKKKQLLLKVGRYLSKGSASSQAIPNSQLEGGKKGVHCRGKTAR